MSVRYAQSITSANPTSSPNKDVFLNYNTFLVFGVIITIETLETQHLISFYIILQLDNSIP